MNFGEIKTVQPEQPKVVRPDIAINKQLQQDGLLQAKELQQSFVRANQDISDSRKIASRVLSISINQSLTIDGRSTDVSPKEKELGDKVSKPLFDFEEVARNVLSFVGGVINKAASQGESDEKLNSLFEQARAGVSMGIKLAEDELGKNTSEEVKEGIAKSKSSIFDGIQKLENNIFNPAENQSIQKSKAFMLQSAELSEFSVRTRDGDLVNIRFGAQESVSQESFKANDDTINSSISYQQSINFSLQVKGELDDGELKAIGDLVAQADDIANTFYRGDIEQAYNAALEIGFDDKQLSSFALQLTKSESSQKMQKYGEVQKYSEQQAMDLKAPKAVAEYLNKLLDGYDQASELLGSKEDFKSVINSLVNEMKDVHVPDILSAINRFHSFNARFLENLNADQNSVVSPDDVTNEKPA